MKPPLDQAGPADAPFSVPGTAGLTKHIIADTIVIPYNDPAALERVLANEDVACFIVEPVMENIGICLPDPGYHEAIREITRRYGTLLILDEVKTGITAGFGGATGYFGADPDLVTLAKSIGGGFPVGAFGGKQEYMDLITEMKVLHLGTYNGNPLVMAATKATLTEACTAAATDEAIARNDRLTDACQAVIDAHDLPAHTVRFGAKGCVTWSRQRGPELPGLQGRDRLHAGLRPVDPRDQPRGAVAAGSRRAVVGVGHARRVGHDALRRRVRRVRRRAHRLTEPIAPPADDVDRVVSGTSGAVLRTG